MSGCGLWTDERLCHVAHVGMSGSEPKVNSYLEFADEVLPRIAASGYNTVQLMAARARRFTQHVIALNLRLD